YLSGIMTLEISLQADAAERFLEPDTFHCIVEIERVGRNLPGVLAAQSYADLFRAVLIHWPGRGMSETDQELVPQGQPGRTRLARTARFVERFGAAFHYDQFLSSDGRRARIRLR